MSEPSTGGSPLQTLALVAILAGGGYLYFGDSGGFREWVSDKFENVSWAADDAVTAPNQYSASGFTGQRQFEALSANVDYLVEPSTADDTNPFPNFARVGGELASTQSSLNAAANDGIDAAVDVVGADAISAAGGAVVRRGLSDPDRIRHGRYPNITIGAWSLDGFGPTKLANRDVRNYIAKVVRRFDVLAINQVAAIERDLIPRMVDEINRGENRYDYVMGGVTGPDERPEQLAFLFDTTTVQVDRRGSYTMDDPDDRFTYDPLVAWFRCLAPPEDTAWTFSVVNVRVDLASARSEVQWLASIARSVARDGRGEDDVVLAGLMQADDAYLLPTLGEGYEVSVRRRSTDIHDRYQTSNIVFRSGPTTEYLGRGGVFDFAQAYRLQTTEAEAITSQLPVHADFTAHEGGQL